MDETVIDVCSADGLGEKQTAKFTIGQGKRAPEGFVVRYQGVVYAWRNQCRHVPVTMDWVENRFLSRDGCWIQCSTHGALYELDTGLCVAGPPAGKRLQALAVAIEDGRIVVRIPSPDGAT